MLHLKHYTSCSLSYGGQKYLLWRVMMGQHDKITLLLHDSWTHPDWCFGLLKKRTKMGGLTDLASVVNKSSVVNIAQLTGAEDGNVPRIYD